MSYRLSALLLACVAVTWSLKANDIVDEVIGASRLRAAVRAGKLDRIEKLLAAGVNVNTDGVPPRFAAKYAPITERELWKVYRTAYRDEPFVRIVKERQGIYRYPEPKILAGSNYCDVGFALDEATGRVVAISAIDNLMKGAAGSAIQAMNLMCGFEETMGLDFPGLHPI